MSEQKLVALAQAALDGLGVDDTVVVAGQFEPRGRSGAAFAGGMIGGEIAGDLGGAVAQGIGIGAGLAAGQAAHQVGSALPPMMIVAASETTVYGLHAKSRRREPDAVVFAVPREGLTATVHQRVNVRVLELIQEETGARIELEGSRIPVTHSKDVIDVLRAASHGDEA
jgi:hypothetical protein